MHAPKRPDLTLEAKRKKATQTTVAALAVIEAERKASADKAARLKALREARLWDWDYPGIVDTEIAFA